MCDELKVVHPLKDARERLDKASERAEAKDFSVGTIGRINEDRKLFFSKF